MPQPQQQSNIQKHEDNKKTVKSRLSSSCTSLDIIVKSKSKTSLGSRPSRTSLLPISHVNSSFSNTKQEEQPFNETLRWEYEVEDSDEEAERIQIYKINRRKRYLAASNKKYADWMSGSDSSCSLTCHSTKDRSVPSTNHRLPDVVASSVTVLHMTEARAKTKSVAQLLLHCAS